MATTADQTTPFLPEMADLPRLRAVEIGGWPGLGGSVRVGLAGARTVLVGKNGAGKSLLLEGIERAARAPFGPSRPGPSTFRCEVDVPENESIGYQYELHAEEPEEDIDPPAVRSGRGRAPAQRWSERCWKVNDGAEIWRAAEGVFSVGNATTPVPPTSSLLNLPNPSPDAPHEIAILTGLLLDVRMVPAGVPRSEASFRREILIPGAAGRWRLPRVGDRAVSLARSLVTLHDRRHETYAEFVAIVQRLGLAHDVEIKVYKDPNPSAQEGERQDFASVLFDDTNIGLLSDGTLRVFEIIRMLLGTPGAVLLIEEPETAVHPGLLRKLLALIDSYAIDRQVVVSTHSPIVVDWCKPEELRLVQRADKATVVRALSAEEVARIHAYLDDEGTFAEYLYSRSDDE